MDSSERDDRLMKYIVSDTRLKAPDGFTEKVMTRVTLERVSRATQYESPFKARLVLISLTVAVLLVILSQLPVNLESRYLSTSMFAFLGNLGSIIPDPDLSRISGLSIPPVYLYIAVTIPLLMIFDRFLSSFFRRRIEK